MAYIDPSSAFEPTITGTRFWRGFVDEQVRRYLDCGLFENGFARVQCPDCHEEHLLAFSCKTRELCPSCAARRAAATAVLLREEVLEEVGHAQWVFVMPKMLRPYFLHHRKLLGGLARAAWETVRGLMVAATGGKGPRPGMVAETFDPAEFLAHVIMHIPEPRRHLVRYYGAYSNVSRGKRRRQDEADIGAASPDGRHVPSGSAARDPSPDARALRRSWAQLRIRRCLPIREADRRVGTRSGAPERA